jgi:alpha-tubulin suppressor-like RCC1 family protein
MTLGLLLGVLSCSHEVQLFVPTRPDASTARDAGADAGPLAADAALGSDGATQDASLPPQQSGLSLSAGSVHACVVVSGKLACWGNGDNGKLGLGDVLQRDAPTRIDPADDWMSVCASEEHTCALKKDQSVHCWGQNGHGELGLGDFVTRDRPTPIPALRAVRLACGGYNTCALTSAEALYCWGDNFEGKLGQGDPFDSGDIPTPTRVAAPTSFREVAVGQGHVCAIARDGSLSCWGRNTDGQLGTEGTEQQLRSPAAVTPERAYRQVAAGQRHTCAIDVSGRLWCWGTDSEGSLGLGVPPETLRRTPQLVDDRITFEDVDVEWFHSCAVSGDGRTRCWGRNLEGQLGVGDQAARSVPTEVAGEGLEQVVVGRFYSCGAQDEHVWCWGEGEQGQLGTGATQRSNVPAAVALP